MSSLLPPNATALMRALESAGARLGDVPLPIRSMWNPDTIPTEFLPFMAWALSVDAWKSYWPEHVKRAVVRNAIQIQRTKGTAQSVRQAVAAFGGNAEIREWFQLTPPGPPHTFESILTISGSGGQSASAEFVDDVIAEVSRVKPVRSHFTFTQGLQATGGVRAVAGARASVYRRVELQAIEPGGTP